MPRMKLPRLVVVISLAFSAALNAAPPPRNVIFLIGDGMGPAHVTLMRELRGNQFNVGRMRLVAMHSTASADSKVTDSAAGATAFASGAKTNNRALGIDAAGNKLDTVLEQAEKLEKSTGVVTTAKFFDATPAAFLAHVKDRSEHGAIVSQMLDSHTELIVGTGIEASGKNGVPSFGPLAKKTGYTLITSKDKVKAASLPAWVALPTQAHDLDQPGLELPTLTEWAIGLLKADPDGFFLVVEHEGIDSSSHDNDGEDLKTSLQSFDQAVGVALDFAAANGDTLVLVTGDHETGGLRLVEAMGKVEVAWSIKNHTAVDIPLFAFGPGLDDIKSFVENIEIGKALSRLLQPQ